MKIDKIKNILNTAEKRIRNKKINKDIKTGFLLAINYIRSSARVEDIIDKLENIKKDV